MKANQKQKNIPVGWKSKKLRDLCEISAGGTPSTSVSRYWNNGTIPWMKSGEINKSILFNTENYITESGLNNSSAKYVPINSVIIALAGQGKTRGMVAINKIRLTTNQSLAFFVPNRELLNYFFLFSDLSRRYEQLRSLSAGDGGRGGLNLGILKRIKILLPPLSEQDRIVAVLGTWDSGIEKLKQKIALKKEIKKGLMQQLLTGKKRLKGFGGEWKNYEIAEVLDYEQPTNYLVSNTNYSDEFTTPVLTAGKTFLLGHTNETEGIYDHGPVIIFDDFTTATKYVDFRFKVKSSAMKMLTAKQGFDLRFVYEKMQLLKLPQGEHKRRYLSEYQYLACKMPGLEEQKAVVEVIETSDYEIASLEKKLSAMQDQKRYLLNNLVTGQIRTPEDMVINQT